MKKTKQNIREQILQKRKNLAVTEKVKLSRSILRDLLLLPDFQKAETVHTYISSKSNEVDTFELIIEVLSQNKKIIVPIANPKTKMMTHSFLYSINDLQKGAFDILEPKNIIPATIDQINIALIPVVAVDYHGNRIGFGGGFYDRFLRSLQCVKVGLAFDFQIVDSIPKEEHDVPLDFIISNNRTITCKGNM